MGAPLVVATILVASSRLPAQTQPGGTVFDTISQEVRSVFERCQSAVVKIQGVDQHGMLSGSGFFVDPSGLIYTSYTIGGEARDLIVSHGNMKYPATRVLADSRSGIALLKTETHNSFLPIGRGVDLGIATPVVTIGYPLDLPLSPNFGMIAGYDLRYLNRYFSTIHIRANVPVQRGQGGAPLLNLKGEVVGILISSLENGSGCFALPIEAAEKVRKDFVRFGEVRPGWIGIKVGEAATAAEGSSAVIEDIMDHAPGARGGLKKGDIVVQIGGRKVHAAEDILNASFFLTAGDQVSVVVNREGRTLPLTLQPTDPPLNQLATLPRLAPAEPRQRQDSLQ